ncbi:WD40-like beta propeller [Dillenia turbinata]|uniref:WD40-like beta propeller n=1 Tax=Dillenia turbinata TaxID=194707 RepID=A0AAN8VNB2_9MAGN
MAPKGTILFSTVGRSNYGFDVFSFDLHSHSENRLTDGVSINFNGHFIDENQSLLYISERTGSSQIFLNRPGIPKPQQLPSAPGSLFHDRPLIKNHKLYFASSHENPGKPFTSWSAVYSVGLDDAKVVRLTPYGAVDYSPAISSTGKFIAVASYGFRPWAGEFHELETGIVVFRETDPSNRVKVCSRGGWPTWCGDSTIYFHRQADDGWWSIYRIDLPENFDVSSGGVSEAPVRVIPSGVHAFTPAAMQDGKRIAVATRRHENNYRHIEIFDVESKTFSMVTEKLNPTLHHYNPFVSPESGFVGYHRYRGKSAEGELISRQLVPVASPIDDLKMVRVTGNFPAVSPNGDLVAYNRDFDSQPGVGIVKSDGSKKWTLLKKGVAFYNSWNPKEKNVIFTSIGPIFESVRATVQIARISFNITDLRNDRDEIEADVKILTKEETGNNAFAACSPDGKFLVFRSGRSGHKNLYIMDAVNGEFDGGSIRQLTDGPWIDTMPSWSTDGELIAFSSNRHDPNNENVFGIYLVRPDGRDLRRVRVAGWEEHRERLNHVCFSPDGEWLVFTANLGGVTAEPVSLPNQFQPYGDLYAVRLDGSGLQRLTWNAYEIGTPTWHWLDEVDLGRLCLNDEVVGDKIDGQFDEPLWIKCLT